MQTQQTRNSFLGPKSYFFLKNGHRRLNAGGKLTMDHKHPTQGGVEIFLVTSDYIKTEFGSCPDEPLGSNDNFNFFPYTTQELCWMNHFSYSKSSTESNLFITN